MAHNGTTVTLPARPAIGIDDLQARIPGAHLVGQVLALHEDTDGHWVLGLVRNVGERHHSPAWGCAIWRIDVEVLDATGERIELDQPHACPVLVVPAHLLPA